MDYPYPGEKGGGMIQWLAIYLVWELLLRTIAVPPENYYNQGNRFYEAGAFQQAEQAYRRAAAGQNLQARAWYNAGNAAYAQGKYALAVQLFEKALDVDAGDEDAWYNLELSRRRLVHLAESQALASTSAHPANPASASSGRGQTQAPAQRPSNPQTLSGQEARPSSRLSGTEADDILAQIQAQENQSQNSPGSGSLQPSAGNRDIFSQTPEEILETMRALTKATYPFKPGATQAEEIPVADEVDW
jgi:Ca-activated chloride channel family protein